jgi:hypothetical protein
MSRTGRPKCISNEGLSVGLWLKTILCSGRRPANEIIQAGELQGFSPKTLNRAKTKIAIISEQEKRIWWWRDPSIAEPEKPKSFQEAVMHKLDEVQRLTQTPRIVTEDGVKAAPDPNEVDEHGFKKHSPPGSLVATISAMQVHAEIKRLAKANTPHEQIVKRVFEWAYPAARLSESTLAIMLRNGGVSVTPRVTRQTEVDF